MTAPDAFEGKVALITGGSSGIGRSVAVALAERGGRVVIADVDSDGGDRTVRELKDAGRETLFIKTDVADAVQVKAAVEKAVSAYGRLDCAFNNAGLMGSPAARVSEGTEENWDRVIDINLKGAWLCMKYEIRAMRKQGGGAIVNAASAAGMSGAFASAPYIASKHGIVGLTKAAALECAQQGIRVNAVCPGYIRTPMLEKLTRIAPAIEQHLIEREPMGRLGTPEEVATAVLWLLSDEASFVTGHALVVDGGILAD
jgi:NAD(P)-dependent dehydrogenase (short-subunit alcohol dehydrogenase family)